MSIFARKKGARADGLDRWAQPRQNGPMLRAMIAFVVLIAAPAVAQGPALPVHGNWCGPNHGAGPILDALDDACMRHDYCTMQVGRLDCGCDLAFMDELAHRPWPNPSLAQKARAVFEAIALTPCTGAQGQGQKLSLAAETWARGVALGQEPPWAVLDRLGALLAEGVARAR